MDTILIATNDEGLRGSLHSILAGSHVLFQAGTLRKMLEVLQDKRIDLVIVDETMDDRQVSEFLPEILETQESVLVFVTAADPRAGHVRTARELGACDILTKPIDEWELTDKTKRSLEHAHSLRERTLMRERIEELRSTLRISVPKGHEVQTSPRGFPSGETSEAFQPLKTFLEPLANIRDSQKLFDMFIEAIADYFTVTKGALVLAGKDS
ncbi:MAG: response regulator, partial [Candidatus Hydrogenedentota bacterium]